MPGTCEEFLVGCLLFVIHRGVLRDSSFFLRPVFLCKTLNINHLRRTAPRLVISRWISTLYNERRHAFLHQKKLWHDAVFIVLFSYVNNLFRIRTNRHPTHHPHWRCCLSFSEASCRACQIPRLWCSVEMGSRTPPLLVYRNRMVGN